MVLVELANKHIVDYIPHALTFNLPPIRYRQVVNVCMYILTDPIMRSIVVLKAVNGNLSEVLLLHLKTIFAIWTFPCWFYLLPSFFLLLNTGTTIQVELIEEGPPRRLKVTYENTETNETLSEEFNTVSIIVHVFYSLHHYDVIMLTILLLFLTGAFWYWKRPRHKGTWIR